MVRFGQSGVNWAVYCEFSSMYWAPSINGFTEAFFGLGKEKVDGIKTLLEKID